MLTGDLSKYLNYYDLWSSYKAEEPEKILVASASIHGHTKAAAHTMAEKLRAKGAKVVEMDLTRTDVSYAVTEASAAAGSCWPAPPTMASSSRRWKIC